MSRINLKNMIKRILKLVIPAKFRRVIRGIKTGSWYNEQKIKRNFNGKPLTPAMQVEIQGMIKKRSDIYLYDEKTARKLADNWRGVINKPQNLRFIENAVPIALCANEGFAPYMAVMLQSLMENSSQQRKYHLIIFERDFSDKTKDYLMNQVSKFKHCEIDFISIKEAFDEIPIASPLGAYYSIDAYSRLLIPYWLDKYPKVIYCDGDMIAKTDIAELYDLDIQNYCMGAAISPTANANIDNETYSFFAEWPVFLFLDKWSRYLSSGVLIFDIKRFKEKISYQDCFKFAIYYTNRYKKNIVDQDVLSYLVGDDYFILSPEWNYVWNMLKKDGKRHYQPSEPNTKLFHFATLIKPWHNVPDIANNPEVLAYRDYAKTIPLYSERIMYN